MQTEIIVSLALYWAGFLVVLLLGLRKWVPRMHPKRKAVGFLLIQAALWPVTAYVALSTWYEEPWQ
ncbi:MULTISPECIES: hypothetical protein [unclassified Enterobacter]|jgi:hypothetical protein|uniref:hypothetical protein n=1 Tax=unclassified Enterobacter TaxID=2608935 RepID=UPI0021474735|nr:MULTISPECIES: hypothetical protein [unclassified Enterobacter]MCR1305069.1 hypothetical protein [Enterobacter sp. FL1277]MCR1310082.1 hypothetical protein [Enterobacter sp. BT1271]